MSLLDQRTMIFAVVDDHEFLRIGVVRAIAAVPNWVVAHSVGTADELLDQDLGSVDLVLLDFTMPGRISGYAAVEAIAQRGVDVIVLTAADPEEVGPGCRERGAVAVISKTDGPDNMRAVIARHTGASPTTPELTNRESEVLSALQEGLQNQEIAQRLGISISGVKRHLERIMDKTSVRTRSGLAAIPLDALRRS